MIAAIVKFLTGGFVDRIASIAETYIKADADKARFEAEVREAAGQAAADIEKSWAETSAKIATATQDTLKAAPLLQRAWAAVLFLQVVVLVFYKIGAPAFQVITGTAWPNPGISLDWAYLLIAAMIGAGPLVMRKG